MLYSKLCSCQMQKASSSFINKCTMFYQSILRHYIRKTRCSKLLSNTVMKYRKKYIVSMFLSNTKCSQKIQQLIRDYRKQNVPFRHFIKQLTGHDQNDNNRAQNKRKLLQKTSPIVIAIAYVTSLKI